MIPLRSSLYLGSFLLAAAGMAHLAAAAGIGDPVTYRSIDGRDLQLWVETPDVGQAPYPCMVFFHGGGWVGGSPGQFNELATHLVKRGMATVQVEYRLLDRKSTDPPTICCADAVAAMEWVAANADRLQLDPERIAAAGGSAGGHLAAYTGIVDSPFYDGTPNKPRALILFNPVCDNGPGEWGAKRVGDRYKEFSPAHNISGDDPPTLYLIGDSDNLVPVETARRFWSKMLAAGVRCDLHIYADQPHGFFNYRDGKNPYYDKTRAAADAFLVSLGWLPPEE